MHVNVILGSQDQDFLLCYGYAHELLYPALDGREVIHFVSLCSYHKFYDSFICVILPILCRDNTKYKLVANDTRRHDFESYYIIFMSLFMLSWFFQIDTLSLCISAQLAASGSLLRLTFNTRPRFFPCLLKHRAEPGDTDAFGCFVLHSFNTSVPSVPN